MLSPGELEMEVTLDKQLYHHGEKIAINLCIRNHSNKTVKKIKAMVQQGVDVVLFQNGQYRNTIACLETGEGKSSLKKLPLSNFFLISHSISCRQDVHCYQEALCKK